MIDHTSCGVTNLDRSVDFYIKALAPLDYQLIMRVPGAAGFGVDGKPDFWIGAEMSPTGTASAPTPVHIAFRAKTRSIVDAFYEAAIAAGGVDNGPPGTRPMYHEHYYGAFIRDPDGNNIEAVCHDPYLG